MKGQKLIFRAFCFVQNAVQWLFYIIFPFYSVNFLGFIETKASNRWQTYTPVHCFPSKFYERKKSDNKEKKNLNTDFAE